PAGFGWQLDVAALGQDRRGDAGAEDRGELTGGEDGLVGLPGQAEWLKHAGAEQTGQVTGPVAHPAPGDEPARRGTGRCTGAVDVGGRELLIGDVSGGSPGQVPEAARAGHLIKAEEGGDAIALDRRGDAGDLGGGAPGPGRG